MSLSRPVAALLMLVLALAGCDRAPSPVAPVTPMPVAAGRDPLIGRWIGVEGMVLDVAAAGAPGRYILSMQWDLDHRGRFDGVARGDTIAFTRDGVAQILRPTTGADTGLKYLAEKTHCLTVRTGEGYCRA